jgi:hypothetical protein
VRYMYRERRQNYARCRHHHEHLIYLAPAW